MQTETKNEKFEPIPETNSEPSRKARRLFLNEKVKCEIAGCSKKVKRKNMFKLNNEAGTIVCKSCLTKLKKQIEEERNGTN
ncbi:MAG: hypothetical protein M0P94_05240 [Candidatus Absconditabacterales bacterium]|nr:hypothetical protein [Candidatus Absconditabacterales bacterium]